MMARVSEDTFSLDISKAAPGCRVIEMYVWDRGWRVRIVGPAAAPMSSLGVFADALPSSQGSLPSRGLDHVHQRMQGHAWMG